MSYATPSDLLKRYDARVLGDLIGDANARVDPSSMLTDPNLQAALDDASGMIDSAIFVANKYAPAELAALTGTGAAYLARITCNLAYGLLVMRRGQPVDEIAQYQEAIDALALLRSGERVFAVGANQAAGNPSASFPSCSVYSNLQLMRDKAKVFPVRRDQRVS